MTQKHRNEYTTGHPMVYGMDSAVPSSKQNASQDIPILHNLSPSQYPKFLQVLCNVIVFVIYIHTFIVIC